MCSHQHLPAGADNTVIYHTALPVSYKTVQLLRAPSIYVLYACKRLVSSLLRPSTRNESSGGTTPLFITDNDCLYESDCHVVILRYYPCMLNTAITSLRALAVIMNMNRPLWKDRQRHTIILHTRTHPRGVAPTSLTLPLTPLSQPWV